MVSDEPVHYQSTGLIIFVERKLRMLDFVTIVNESVKKGSKKVYPKFQLKASKDLMIQGGKFLAWWDEENKLWSTDEYALWQRIDEYQQKEADILASKTEDNIKIMWMWDSDSGSVDRWKKYCERQMVGNSYHELDEKLIFSNQDTKKRDYASKRLPYPLEKGECPAWDEIISTLYSEEERHKIEWSIGSIVNGDSTKNQKFLVMYGSAGTGKSTILNIIQMLFEGYYSVFDAKALGQANNSFALEPFRTKPLVAIQHDGDLSKIEDNTRLNSIVSHELMTVNEKFKSIYSTRYKAFLFMGTNKPVKITDAKSGLIRRLIDVSPSGNKIPYSRYKELMHQVAFELGAIAWKCKEIYEENPTAYDDYIPLNMMGASNDFYNYMLEYYIEYKEANSVTLKKAYDDYNNYVKVAQVAYPLSRRAFQEELKSYFEDFHQSIVVGGTHYRSLYSGFKHQKFEYKSTKKKQKEKTTTSIDFKEQDSIFDIECKDAPAQYANDSGTPLSKWQNCKTILDDLDTHMLHYVKVPENHIVIDFDIPGEDGSKSFEKNLEAASKWPPTYSELSKSGAGIHLHYIYEGDVSKLSKIYDEHIEIKVFNGNSSLRRLLTKCNNKPIATISSGLPLKGEDKKVVNKEVVKSEKGLRTLIKRNLAKEIHPSTKSSIDFIFKILEDAYESGLVYDVSDMQPIIFAFASGSTNQSGYCVDLVSKMKFKSKEDITNDIRDVDERNTFYDVEVFPNLFIINWKYEDDPKVHRMINPTSGEVEQFINDHALIGFNCRRYDNHILYASMMGYTNEQIYNVSQRIVNGDSSAYFGAAWNISKTDVYDFSSKKQSLKKFEIELGLHHLELGLPWDQPVPKELWEKVAIYCDNDVIATEAVFKDRKGDFLAREILADVAGGSLNDTTNSLTTKIIFGNVKHPNLEYRDLSEEFPGYEYIVENGKAHNMYRGIDVGFGGLVLAEPGMYGRTITFDVASMHPSSIIALNAFGDYTERFKELLDARIAIKHKDFDRAAKMLDGKLAPYLTDPANAKSLAQALKIAINSVYGLTSASFDNPFRDPRNVNNIVALRGALFMKTLRDEVVARGGTVIHIKTDSIKVVEPSDELCEFIIEFGKKYGYNFEIEHIFERICLVNNAVYIAKLAKDDPEEPGQWTATGTQFAVPYVFKTLFSHEPIIFEDLCETKEVKQGDMYICHYVEGEPKYQFIGHVGSFCPIKKGRDGGELYRFKDGKYYRVTGTKDYEWLESETVKTTGKFADIDESYYISLVNDAYKALDEQGDAEWFIFSEGNNETVPFTGGKIIKGVNGYEIV